MEAGKDIHLTGATLEALGNKLYGQVGWIELYFEIAVYNSQYQIGSVHRGECYE